MGNPCQFSLTCYWGGRRPKFISSFYPQNTFRKLFCILIVVLVELFDLQAMGKNAPKPVLKHWCPLELTWRVWPVLPSSSTWPAAGWGGGPPSSPTQQTCAASPIHPPSHLPSHVWGAPGMAGGVSLPLTGHRPSFSTSGCGMGNWQAIGK